MPHSKLLRRIAAWALLLPAAVAAFSFLLVYLIPACEPQLYGVGICMVGSTNIAVGLILATFGGLYVTAVLGIFLSGPLYALSWWLDYKRSKHAA